MSDKQMLTFDISPTALQALKNMARAEGISIKRVAEKLIYHALWPHSTERCRKHLQQRDERTGLDTFLASATSTLRMDE
jgi:hypothetical protein